MRLTRIEEAEEGVRILLQSTSLENLLAVAGVIDENAAVMDQEIPRQRVGAVLRSLLEPEASRDKTGNLELRLRYARAAIYSADYRQARLLAEPLRTNMNQIPQELLADAADLFVRVDDFSQAALLYWRLVQTTPTGSPAWFAARYGEALCAFRMGKNSLAVRIIDATAILHPNLGGASLKEKFERLRQRAAFD